MPYSSPFQARRGLGMLMPSRGVWRSIDRVLHGGTPIQAFAIPSRAIRSNAGYAAPVGERSRSGFPCGRVQTSVACLPPLRGRTFSGYILHLHQRKHEPELLVEPIVFDPFDLQGTSSPWMASQPRPPGCCWGSPAKTGCS